jgi:hypothetical protein
MSQTAQAPKRAEPETKLYEFTIHFADASEKPLVFRKRKYPNDAGRNEASEIANGGYARVNEDGSIDTFAARAIARVNVREVTDSAVSES